MTIKDTPEEWEIRATETPFVGNKTSVRTDEVVMPDGSVVRRDYQVHPGSVAVLALDEEDRVLLIRQYRHPVRQKLWEIPAGLLDVPGENPLHAAQRELYEEAHVKAGEWRVLTDLYTIWRDKGTLDGLKMLLVGDMRMRTMHSILYASSQFDMETFVVCPPELALRDDFKVEIAERSVNYREVESVQGCIADADVIYMEPIVQADYTQSRVDPTTEKGTTPPAYQVTRRLLHEKAKQDSIVLHSLPRMDELTPDVDSTRHARYWAEAANGVSVRMALLALVLGAAE